MAHDVAVQLTALCAVASFLWVSYTFERHSLVETPRLSSFLVLFIAGAFSFLISFFSAWLPGANGRFDEDHTGLAVSQQTLPRRPRRYFLPALVACIVLRLEVFHSVNFNTQCTSPGIESFLCTILVAYDVFSRKKTRPSSSEPPDPWATVLDDLLAWLRNTPVSLLVSVLIFSYGTFLAVSIGPRSTYFCSALLDSRPTVISLQLLGLLLDAVIAILLWRILAWAKTTKIRLRTLSGILVISSLVIALLWIGVRLYQPRGSALSPAGFLYIFDLFIDSCALSTLVVSVSLWICAATPVTPASTITFLCGIVACMHNVIDLGKWSQTSRLEATVPLYIIATGYVVFLYAGETRSVIFLRRILIVLLLAGAIIGVTIYVFLRSTTLDRHPLNKLIYDTRIEADRWLRHATVSDSLPIAVKEYQERHDGRDPPQNFDKWYTYAKHRNSVIIDHFNQIASDIAPFWGLKPSVIRERIALVKEASGVALVDIYDGKVTYTPDDLLPEDKAVMEALVQMISTFAEHLPASVQVPVNLNDAPYVLAPWEEVQRHTENAKSKVYKFLAQFNDRRRSVEMLESLSTPESGLDQDLEAKKKSILDITRQLERNKFPVHILRHLAALGCPPGSPGRSGLHWNARDFCTSCADPHSEGQFLTQWEASLDMCAQPDMTRLHGFHLQARPNPPFAELVPMFSRAKTSQYSDILIPLTHQEEDGQDSPRDFQTREDNLYWRGALAAHATGHQILRGNHRHRLVHLVNNATAADEVTMMMPVGTNGARYAYQVVHAAEANVVLPFDLGVSDYSACKGRDCDVAIREFGMKDGAITKAQVNAAPSEGTSTPGDGETPSSAKEPTSSSSESSKGELPVSTGSPPSKRPSIWEGRPNSQENTGSNNTDTRITKRDSNDLPAVILPHISSAASPAKPYNHRYILHLDSDAGPPPDFLRTLRSTSVPFLGTAFWTWHTERLTPWLHFVPVDMRFQGLHSTLAYFVGLQGRGKLNGLEVDMPSGAEDGKWIAEQGKGWARRALRKEDMEVYLFRLLLEWGRVVDDKREEMGFRA